MEVPVTIVSKATDNYPGECTGNLKSKRNLVHYHQVQVVALPFCCRAGEIDGCEKGYYGKGIQWAGLHGAGQCT